MKCICVLLALTASVVLAQEGTPLDEDKRRFVLPSEAQPKSTRCEGYDYFLQDPRPNGTRFIDRKYFKQGETTQVCPDGVLFSIAADLCICSTHVRSSFLFNRDRCVTITGSAQNDKFFSLAQRGEASRDVYVGGYADLVRTSDNCYGSNSSVYRSLNYMSANSLSRRDFEMTIGFNIPAGVNIGREFQIFGTSPCTGDNRAGSFVINYVTAGFNARPQLTANFLVRDKLASLGAQETSASITCTVPASVNHPSGNPQLNYFWDPQDPTNKVQVTVDMNDFGTLKMALYNNQMDSLVVSNGGFCQNNVVNFPLGRRGGGAMIAERNCPSFFGKAPGADFMCVFDVTIKRDCIEQIDF